MPNRPFDIGEAPLRDVIGIPANLPVAQVEIEVVASLLDDWESLFPIAPEAADQQHPGNP
jgi:hypothetical protein